MPEQLSRTSRQPARKWTPAKQLTAEVAAACGVPLTEIARVVGCSAPLVCHKLISSVRQRRLQYAKDHNQKNPERAAWKNMLRRCYNPELAGFRDYGTRGIRVCERWRNSFDAFAADVGLRPSSKHSLERKDVNGHYEPSNCYWATKHEQTRNTRRNVWVFYDNKRMVLVDACRAAGLTLECVQSRRRRGWPENRWFEPKLAPGERLA